jgi:hypothetical protein
VGKKRKRRPMKAPEPGKCVHCLKYFDQLTWDHVLPESYYLPGDNNQKAWKKVLVVPSCNSCNNKLSRIENDLLITIGATRNPKDPIYGHLYEKFCHSLMPGRARRGNRKERDKRTRFTKLKKRIQSPDEHSNTVALEIVTNPATGKRSSQQYPIIKFSVQDFERFAKKLVCGMEYVFDKKIEEKEILLALPTLDENHSFRDALASFGDFSIIRSSLEKVGNSLEFIRSIHSYSEGKQVIHYWFHVMGLFVLNAAVIYGETGKTAMSSQIAFRGRKYDKRDQAPNH